MGQQRDLLGLVGLFIRIENVLDWMDHVVAGGDHDTQRARRPCIRLSLSRAKRKLVHLFLPLRRQTVARAEKNAQILTIQGEFVL